MGEGGFNFCIGSYISQVWTGWVVFYNTAIYLRKQIFRTPWNTKIEENLSFSTRTYWKNPMNTVRQW